MKRIRIDKNWMTIEYEYGNKALEESGLLEKLAEWIDSFVLERYKEFFGKEYKKGDTIPKDKKKEWKKFVWNMK